MCPSTLLNLDGYTARCFLNCVGDLVTSSCACPSDRPFISEVGEDCIASCPTATYHARAVDGRF